MLRQLVVVDKRMNIGCVVGNNSGSTAVRPEVTSISPDSGEGVYDAPWDVGKKPLASAFLSLKGDEFARSGLSRRSFDPGQHPTVSVSDKSTPVQIPLGFRLICINYHCPF